MTLTDQEANEFVADVLKLSNARERLERNRPDFLDDLIGAFYSSVPFQNVTLLSQPAEERRVPTWEDIKAAVNGGYGGLCYTLSAFMNALLTALGYDTYLAGGCVQYDGPTHMLVIVRDLTTRGSLHLVDVPGYPTFQAIPLDFEKESPVYHHSVYPYKFIKTDSKVIWRMHRQELEQERPLVHGRECFVDGWRRFCQIDITPRDLSSFYETMVVVYTKPELNATRFLTSLHAVWYPGLKLIALRNCTFKIECERGKEETKLLSTRDELTTIMINHFPNILVPHLTRALDYLHLLPPGPI